MSERLIERLAEYSHSAWAGWMRYMFDRGTFNDDGTWTMPDWAVKRWRRQATTEYGDLPFDEKPSYRAEAAKILAVIDDSNSKCNILFDALNKIYVSGTPDDALWQIALDALRMYEAAK